MKPDPLAAEMRRLCVVTMLSDSTTGEMYSLSVVSQWKKSDGDQNTREPGEKSDLENLTLPRLNGSTSETNRVTGHTEWRDLT